MLLSNILRVDSTGGRVDGSLYYIWLGRQQWLDRRASSNRTSDFDGVLRSVRPTAGVVLTLGLYWSDPPPKGLPVLLISFLPEFHPSRLLSLLSLPSYRPPTWPPSLFLSSFLASFPPHFYP